MNDLLLFPCSGNAKEAVGVVHAINQIKPTWRILGFVDDDPGKAGLVTCGYKVLGGRSILASFPDAFVMALNGRPETCRERLQIIADLNIERERFCSLIHPSATIGPECTLGANCLIQAGVRLTANVRLADHVIILPNTVVSHDTLIGRGSMIGSNVSISGSVVIGEESYIGSGSKIIQEIEIGDRTMIGLGTVLLKNTSPGRTYVGNPARELNPRNT